MCACEFCDEEAEGFCEFCSIYCPGAGEDFSRDRSFTWVIRWQAHRWKRTLEEREGLCPITYTAPALAGQLWRTVRVSLEAKRLDEAFREAFPYVGPEGAAP